MKLCFSLDIKVLDLLIISILVEVVINVCHLCVARILPKPVV